MKNNLFYVFVALMVTLSSCKYEEGVGISLRSKRDRVANEWMVSEYTVTDPQGTTEDQTSKYNIVNGVIYSSQSQTDSTIESWSYLLIMDRGGFYTLGIVNERGESIDPRRMVEYLGTGSASGKTQPNTRPDPLDIHYLASGGEWSFISKHSRLQLQHDLAGSNFPGDGPTTATNTPVVFDIIKLSNEELKLRAIDVDGNVHNYTLTPLSEEKYISFNHLVETE